MMSYVLQYLRGFEQLGHDLVFVERAPYENACYDVAQGCMSNDCSYGLRVVGELFQRFGLDGKWCFVDVHGRHFGMTASTLHENLSQADVFIDMGTHGSLLEWLPESVPTVLIDGEPGYNQIKLSEGEFGPSGTEYDYYYTNGRNVGTPASPAPTAGKTWGHTFHPVDVRMFERIPVCARGAFSTVMNWTSHASVSFGGRTLGQKDIEFEKFIDLPRHTSQALEVAVAGPSAPRARLRAAGWGVLDAIEATASYDAFLQHVARSKGEFTVCKNVFVELHTAWFSDRSAAYLAAGRPVVMQDTGFSEHLPVGSGLFAVTNVDEAAAAIDAIASDYDTHSRDAKEVAVEHLDTRVVLAGLLEEVLG